MDPLSERGDVGVKPFVLGIMGAGVRLGTVAPDAGGGTVPYPRTSRFEESPPQPLSQSVLVSKIPKSKNQLSTLSRPGKSLP